MGNQSLQVTYDTLSTGERWDDAPYLTRMLFSRMTKGAEEGSTGYGISTYQCDNEYPIIVLTPGKRTVVIEDYQNTDWSGDPEPVTREITFNEFLDYARDVDSLYDLVEAINASVTV